MRDLAAQEVDFVSGGLIGSTDPTQLSVGRGIGIGIITNAIYDVARTVILAVLGGPPAASSNTSGFGVVGPGSSEHTDPSSANSINGADKESDTYIKS